LRILFSLVALCLGGAGARAADAPHGPVLTTTDGKVYVWHNDGYYPASAVPVPTAMPSAKSCVCGDGCTCPAGACPAQCPVSAVGADALAEVNAKRAARGLRPFVRDEALTVAAGACAAFRAANRIFGHTVDDFRFLAAGVRAHAAGCAAWPAHMGWGACCTYENYTHAGAAFAVGADGKRYMHLFVSNGGSRTSDSPVCASGTCSAPGTVQLWGGTYYQNYAAPASGCAGGSCPAPTRRGLFR
jgi:hypothetical protein